MLVGLPKTACWKHSPDLEAASKAAVEALAKLDLFLTSVGLLTRPEVCKRHRRPVYFPEPARISSEYIK